jgi:hypothetical protein
MSTMSRVARKSWSSQRCCLLKVLYFMCCDGELVIVAHCDCQKVTTRGVLLLIVILMLLIVMQFFSIIFMFYAVNEHETCPTRKTL